MRDPILLQANNKDANQSVNRRSQIFVLFYFGSLRPSQHYSARSGRDFRGKTSSKDYCVVLENTMLKPSSPRSRVSHCAEFFRECSGSERIQRSGSARGWRVGGTLIFSLGAGNSCRGDRGWLMQGQVDAVGIK